MIEMISAGFASVFSVQTVFLITSGVILGIIFGAVPGLNTAMAVALCLPITYTLDAVNGVAMIMGLFIGGASGGLISAILLNTQAQQLPLQLPLMDIRWYLKEKLERL